MRTHSAPSGHRVLVVVCDVGDEAVEATPRAVGQHGIGAAQVSAVGGFRPPGSAS